MSDPLAEALYEDICRRATVPMDVWKDAPEYQRRNLESLAAAARAFIGDEIADLRLDRPDEQRITVREVEVWNRAIDAATTTIRNGAKK